MEDCLVEWRSMEADTMERPSEGFIRAVAELLETDAEDILAEMGYVGPEAVEAEAVRA